MLIPEFTLLLPIIGLLDNNKAMKLVLNIKKAACLSGCFFNNLFRKLFG